GKLDLDPQPFDVRAELADTLRPLALRAYGKGLELAYRVADDVPDRLVGDWPRLRQVLTNLVGNAVKFTDQGEVVVSVAVDSGQWTVDRKETESPSAADGVVSSSSTVHCPLSTVHLRFEVSDTGIGIAPEKRKAIF